jgi:solute carrier family 25 citrate transporter 1
MGPKKNEKTFSTHLIAGGAAGFCEALSCHPLDTIKVRLQLRGMRPMKVSGGKPVQPV